MIKIRIITRQCKYINTIGTFKFEKEYMYYIYVDITIDNLYIAYEKDMYKQ